MAPSRGYAPVRAAETISELRDGTRDSLRTLDKKSEEWPPWKQTAWLAARLWWVGFVEACCFHRVLLFLVRSRVILKRTVQCFLLNGIFLGSIFFLEGCLVPFSQRVTASKAAQSFTGLSMWLSASLQGVSEARSSQGLGSRPHIRAILVALYSILWLYPVYVISFIINCLWYNEIAKHAFRVLTEERSGNGNRISPGQELCRLGCQVARCGWLYGKRKLLGLVQVLNGYLQSFSRTPGSRAASARAKSEEGRAVGENLDLGETSRTNETAAVIDQDSGAPPPLEGLSKRTKPQTKSEDVSSSSAGTGVDAPLADPAASSDSSRAGKSEPDVSGNKSLLDPLLRGIGEQIFSLVMLTGFSAQIFVVSLVPYVGRPISFLFMSWLYAYYCFDYQWSFASWSLEKRLHFFETNWAFFAGFGTPCVLATFFQSTLVSAGIGAVLFPLFILVATASDPTKASSIVGGGRVPTPLGRMPIFRTASAQASFLIRVISRAFS